jgi:hypothetical protein
MLFFRQKVGSCPPPGKFLPSPGKKSADAHVSYPTSEKIELRLSQDPGPAQSL